MQKWWIPARAALDAIALDNPGDAITSICSRAHSGLLVARARLFITERGRFESTLIPTQFWWATGHEALEQDWEAGDFSTWIDRESHWQAFGVEFDFIALKDMLSPERGAELSRSYSVVGNADWISAQQARHFVWETLHANPVVAGNLLIEHLKFGFIPSRAVLMQRSPAKDSGRWDLEEREWQVPDWFWHEFTLTGSSAQDWAQGTFSGLGTAPCGRFAITLRGVHFSKAAIQSLASADAPETGQASNKGGRPRKEWWDDLWCAVWGKVYRGDLQPKSQADIERAMMDWVEAREESVSESTIKPLARKMFVEIER